jgi:hypothetical protein
MLWWDDTTFSDQKCLSLLIQNSLEDKAAFLPARNMLVLLLPYHLPPNAKYRFILCSNCARFIDNRLLSAEIALC